MTAISQQDWQDMEDGRALRELLAVVNEMVGDFDIELSDDPGEIAETRYMVRILDTGRYGMGPTIAAAADKAREALR